MASSRKTILIVSQTFVPDPASVGQHMADVAFELARRGHSVRVYASGQGYEDASIRYPRREMLQGADIRRFRLSSFGKKSIIRRVLGTAAFQIQAFFAALFTPNLAGIFFSTSPPLIGLPMCIVAMLRRKPVAYWAMDLNPDQLIALGKLKRTAFTTRVLEAINKFILKRAKLIIALDRFMAKRLADRGISREKMLIMPPWPHEEHIASETAENPFRTRHGMTGKFVIMYSGNHSPSNPLTTLLGAAVKLKDDPTLHFAFVGGGHGKKEVEQYIKEYSLTNAISLPYQPLSELKYSLTAADIHVVSLGESMVGIIHPCKIYGAMTAGRPILFLGPKPSHISDLLEKHELGFQVSHGDVAGAVEVINRFRSMSTEQLHSIGHHAQEVLEQSLSQKLLAGQFCNAVEIALDVKVSK